MLETLTTTGLENYTLYDTNNNGDFEEYEPWPPSNHADYEITDPNIGNFAITGNFIEMLYKLE